MQDNIYLWGKGEISDPGGDRRDCKGTDNIQILTLGDENTSTDFIVIFNPCIYVISTFLHMLAFIVKFLNLQISRLYLRSTESELGYSA